MRSIRFTRTLGTQTDQPIPAWKPDLVLINKNKRTCRQVTFAIPSTRRQSENERKRKDRQILGSCLRAEKLMKYEGDGDTNCSWNNWNGPQRHRKETMETEDQRKNREHLDHGTAKISSNTQKSLRDLKRLQQKPLVKIGVKNLQIIIIIIIIIKRIT